MQRTQPVNPLRIGPRNVGREWHGSGGDEQLIEGLPLDMRTLQLTHADPPLLDVDVLDFVEGVRRDILLVAEGCGGAGDQCLGVVDNPADVIGNASSRV